MTSGARKKHHELEYLEELMRKSPGGITVAWLCRHFGIDVRTATDHLRRLEKAGLAVMKEENRVMVWRAKE